MAFPDLTFRDQLPPDVRQELEQYSALQNGYLATEHNSEGGHTHITAESVTVAEGVFASGDGTFEGDVTAHTGTANESALTTVVETDVDDGGGGPALVIGSGDDRLAIYVESAGANDYIKFSFGDKTPLMIRRNGTDFFVGPGPVTNTTCGSHLGSSLSAQHVWDDAYIGTVFQSSSDTAGIGKWTAVTHNGANFTASSGNWTVDSGDQITLAYTRIFNTLVVAFVIATTDVSSTPTQLRIAIPASLTATRRVDAACSVVDAGTPVQGFAYVAASGTTINIEKLGGAAFTATAGDNTSVSGTLIFEVS